METNSKEINLKIKLGGNVIAKKVTGEVTEKEKSSDTGSYGKNVYTVNHEKLWLKDDNNIDFTINISRANLDSKIGHKLSFLLAKTKDGIDIVLGVRNHSMSNTDLLDYEIDIERLTNFPTRFWILSLFGLIGCIVIVSLTWPNPLFMLLIIINIFTMIGAKVVEVIRRSTFVSSNSNLMRKCLESGD